MSELSWGHIASGVLVVAHREGVAGGRRNMYRTSRGMCPINRCLRVRGSGGGECMSCTIPRSILVASGFISAHLGNSRLGTIFTSQNPGFSGISTVGGDPVCKIASIIRRRLTSRCQTMPHVRNAENRDSTLIKKTKRRVDELPRLEFDVEVVLCVKDGADVAAEGGPVADVSEDIDIPRRHSTQ